MIDKMQITLWLGKYKNGKTYILSAFLDYEYAKKVMSENPHHEGSFLDILDVNCKTKKENGK